MEKITFDMNAFRYLPGDLFEGFKNLQFISFWNCKLEFIEPNILDGLDKLKHVDFRMNPNYNKCTSIYKDAYRSNATLEELKSQLLEKFFSRFQFLGDLRKSKENLTRVNDSKTLLDLQINQHNNSKGQPKPVASRLFADLKAHIQDETTKDFRIQIDDREFPVHKFLLAARSPTLAEILKNNPEVENLNLVDISMEIFEIILKFLYTDELPGDKGTNFLHLFAAAGKLKIQELKNFAACKIIDTIDAKYAMDALILSNKYEHDGLRQKAFDEVKKQYPRIEFLDKWATEPEAIIAIIEKFKKKEEAIRKLEEEFEDARISK